MNDANVKLSKNEFELVTDKQVILTKNLIIEKVYGLFGILSGDFQQLVQERKGVLPADAFSISPKISKGEQYLQLPYVILDYPRFYTRQDVLAIRCFFWWGGFFSITLHLAGRFKSMYEAPLNAWIKSHQNSGWYINVGADAWQHHFESDNYMPIEEAVDKMTGEIVTSRTEFVKIAKKLPLQQWDGAIGFFEEEFGQLLAVFKY